MIKKISKESKIDVKTMRDIRGGCGGDDCSCGCDMPGCKGDFTQIGAIMGAAASWGVSSVT